MPTDADYEATMAGIARLDRQITVNMKIGGKMQKHRAAYNKAINALADNIVKPGQMLSELRADRDRYPAEFYEQEHRRLTQWARGHDSAVLSAIREYADLAASDARKLRSQAEADRPAAERTAEMLERQALLSGEVRADVLLAQAEDALAADRPRRAAFLLGVARERGGSILDDLPGRIEDALDELDETRAQARAIEDEANANASQFEVLRLRALAAVGLGVETDGTAGNGTSEAVARANVARKLAAWHAGEDYSDPTTEHAPVGAAS